VNAGCVAVLLVAMPLASATARIIPIPADFIKIQQGIDAAVDGDTVLVSPGVYLESLDFKGKRILVRSGAGPDSTILEPAAARLPAVLFASGEDSLSVLDGLTVRAARNAVGILCLDAGPIIQHCVITDCINDGYGAAIKCDSNASPTIRHNVIHHNDAQIFAAIYVEGQSTSEIAYNVIHHNSGGLPGVGISHGLAYIHHNVLHDNTGTGLWWFEDAAIYIRGSGQRVINNTLVRNTVGIFSGSGVSTVRNNIVTSGLIGIREDGASNFDHNNVWNVAYPDEGVPPDFSEDPMFVDTLDDFRLTAGSPCIDAGHPDAAYEDPDGTRNDLGALPLGGFGPTPPTPLAPAHDSIVPTLYPVFSWTASREADGGGQVEYDLRISIDSLFTSATEVDSLQFNSYSPVAPLEQGRRYWWKVTSRDPDGRMGKSTTEVFRTFLSGDVNGSLGVDLADIVVLVNFVFKAGSLSAPGCAADVNGDDEVTGSDIVTVVNFVFKAGPALGSSCD
jgi:hypothetical protein